MMQNLEEEEVSQRPRKHKKRKSKRNRIDVQGNNNCEELNGKNNLRINTDTYNGYENNEVYDDIDTSCRQRINELKSKNKSYDDLRNGFDYNQTNFIPISNNRDITSLTNSCNNIRIYEPPKWTNHKSNTDEFEEYMLEEKEKELENFFPDRILHLTVTTWNMCSNINFDEDLTEFIKSDYSDNFSDIYLFGFQECPSEKSVILERIQNTLGPQFVIVKSEENGKLFSILVTNKSLIWHLTILGSAGVSLHVTPTTKGVAAISFQLFGSKLLFLNSHLSSNTQARSTSDEGRNEARIKDYKDLVMDKDLALKVSGRNSSDSPILEQFDNIIWAGDLNFRTKLTQNEVTDLMNNERNSLNGVSIEYLMEQDELKDSQVKDLAFQDFEEAQITFFPTYKFKLMSSEYVENRVPSYTDRILFKNGSGRSLECVKYESIESWKFSDHKPVRAIFQLILQPQTQSPQGCSGIYDMDLYSKCFHNATKKRESSRSTQRSSSVCVIQ